MAEGSGGEAATFSFDGLTQAASRATQMIRAQLSPPETRNTWLGPSSVLSDAVAGSVLLCESSEDGPFAAVVPPKAPSSSPVRRLRGVVSIRVSRDGSLGAARYEELQSLHQIVKSIVPGVLAMGGYKGALADTVRLLESGEPVTLSVDAPSPPETSPVFTVKAGQEAVIASSADFASILHELSVHAVLWAEFIQGDGWGLPPLAAPPLPCSISWASESDALGIAEVFGLPPVSSNVEALQFLFGLCEPPLPLISVEELTHGFAEDAPLEARAAVEALLAQLSEITPSRPEIVDSVHSRLRAIRQSTDAPELFVAFGRAWRQGALEPPSRHPSRSASPSASRRRGGAPSSPRTPAVSTLLDEVNAMSPDTVRQRLVEALAGDRGAAARPASWARAAAAGGAASASPAERTATPAGRPTAARTPRHSGQLGGLFPQGPTATAPLFTATRPAAAPPACTPAFHHGPSTSTAPAAAHSGGATVQSVGSVLRTLASESGEAMATAVIVPAVYHHLPVTAVVPALVSQGMPDIVAQFAHAAGDPMPTTAGSAYEAISLLRHMEEVLADLRSAVPSFSFTERQPASDWGEAVEAIQTLLGKHSSAFRAKRQRSSAEPSTAPVPDIVEEKPPVGSYKQVPTATAAERPGACDAQLLEDIASAAVLRREHVRSSPFCATTTIVERDAALAGELSHFCSAYGQAATAYLLSNGTAQTALSGVGVPMALAAIRGHLLARATQLVQSTVGFERALSMHAKCSSLAMSFLTGIVVVEDCVTILGGSAPHEDAEIRREGGAVSTGTLGSVSGANAQLSIREAFALWGQGLHLVLGSIPGVPTSGTDFAVGVQLKKVPRELSDAKLLSICRYMTSRLGVALYAHRTQRGAPLPDVGALVTKATTTVFQERDLDQRSEERAAAITAPLEARLQELEAAVAKSGKGAGKPVFAQDNKKGGSSGVSRFASRASSSKSVASVKEETSKGAPATSAQEAAQQFITSLGSADVSSDGTSPQPVLASSGSSPSSGDYRITSRLKALVELSALYRRHVGMDPKGDPTQEPCAYKALFGQCAHDKCARCSSGKSFPRQLVDAVKVRCDRKVWDQIGRSKGGKPRQPQHK